MLRSRISARRWRCWACCFSSSTEPARVRSVSPTTPGGEQLAAARFGSVALRWTQQRPDRVGIEPEPALRAELGETGRVTDVDDLGPVRTGELGDQRSVRAVRREPDPRQCHRPRVLGPEPLTVHMDPAPASITPAAISSSSGPGVHQWELPEIAHGCSAYSPHVHGPNGASCLERGLKPPQTAQGLFPSASHGEPPKQP
jgi:hypothetical protein